MLPTSKSCRPALGWTVWDGKNMLPDFGLRLTVVSTRTHAHARTATIRGYISCHEDPFLTGDIGAATQISSICNVRKCCAGGTLISSSMTRFSSGIMIRSKLRPHLKQWNEFGSTHENCLPGMRRRKWHAMPVQTCSRLARKTVC